MTNNDYHGHNDEKAVDRDTATMEPQALFPLHLKIPAGYHAVVTMVFYGKNRKKITICDTVSGEPVGILMSCITSPCNLLILNADTEDIVYTIATDCMSTGCFDSSKGQLLVPHYTLLSGSDAYTSVCTYIIDYSKGSGIPTEAIGITIVIQVGTGPILP